MERNYLYGFTSEENPYLAIDYPWGFNLRTKKYWWIETKKRFGQRIVTRTLDPKTNIWCAPKYGTFSAIIVFYLDENNHIQAEELGKYRAEEEVIWFKNKHVGKLDDYQNKYIEGVLKAYNDRKKV